MAAIWKAHADTFQTWWKVSQRWGGGATPRHATPLDDNFSTSTFVQRSLVIPVGSVGVGAVLQQKLSASQVLASHRHQQRRLRVLGALVDHPRPG